MRFLANFEGSLCVGGRCRPPQGKLNIKHSVAFLKPIAFVMQVAKIRIMGMISGAEFLGGVMSEADFDELSMWQDVLDDVMSGNVDGLICPFCDKKSVEVDMESDMISVKCSECGRWIEGQNAF